MATVQDIQTTLDQLTSDVAAQTTVIGSVETLITGQVAQIKSLSDQIAALQAGTVTQAQIDALATEAANVATALESNTKSLAAAVPQNAPPPPPVATPPAPGTA